MYGLVNKALQDFVLTVAGEEAWFCIRHEAGMNDLALENTINYDDQVTLDLIAAACKVLDIQVNPLLFEFGRHWVVYTSREGWSNHFKMFGDSFIECLQGLDEMHQRVKDAMPDSRMPRFKVSDDGENYYLDYYSDRHGFVPMVEGILQSLAERFDEKWKVAYLPVQSESAEFERFSLERVESGKYQQDQQAA